MNGQNELLDLVTDLDKRYFGGRLSAAGYRIDRRNLDKPPGTPEYFCGRDGKYHHTILEEGTLGTCIEAHRVILVHHHDGDAEALRITLLHEMAHAAVDLDKPLRKGADPHGKRFVRELRRLARAGETSMRPEARFYSMSQLGREIQRRQFGA